MVASRNGFYVSLYEEHLEACSVLLEQSSAYRHDPSLTWDDVGDWEQRLARHLDALATGNAIAVQVCERKAHEGDAGEREAALRVLCRRGRKDAVYAALRDVDEQDPEAVQPLAAALAAEAPEEWLDELVSIAARHTRLAAVLAPLFGSRRVADAAPALAAAADAAPAPAPARVQLLEALGRIATVTSGAALERHLQHTEPGVAAAAAVAALRAGHEPTVARLLAAVPVQPALAVPLALGAAQSAVPVLESLARTPEVTDDVLLALGLLGDLAAVRAVFDCLALPERAAAAALALQLITGAELYADVFVADEIDPDELFDEERARYEATGELPKRPDGTPYGATVTLPVVDPAVWKDWLSQNKARFDRELRYRYGEPYSPAALLRALRAPRVPNRIRALVCDEVRVRYGLDLPLEIDMPVGEQQRILARFAQWIDGSAALPAAGRWYFHGRPLR